MRALELGTPGELRARLNGLVLAGRKRATAGLLSEYAEEDEPLEIIGERLALVDDDGRKVGVVEVTDVEVVPFGEVPWAFAQAEGEGDESIEEWRDGHRRFFAGFGIEVDDLTPTTLVRFRLVTDD